MKILLMCGSARERSKSREVISYVENRLQTQQIETEIFDVRQHVLPLYNGEEECFRHIEVRRLQKLAKEADGFFICTPEYHGAMTGSLKNALDFLSFDYFSQKPVAIAAASGGGKGGINALNNLRLTLRAVGAAVTTGQVVFDPEDVLDQSDRGIAIKNRLHPLIQELTDFVKWRMQNQS